MKVRIPQNQGGGMQNMLKQAQKMQEDMQIKQAELEAKEYDVKAGGGVIDVKINGKREILSVKLAEEIVDPDDIEMLQDLVLSAVNEALRKADDMVQEEMSKVAGIPAGSMPGNMFR